MWGRMGGRDRELETDMCTPLCLKWVTNKDVLYSHGILLTAAAWMGAEFRTQVYVWLRTRRGQPTPVFLPREFRGQRSPVGCRLWGRTESDTTEVT